MADIHASDEPGDRRMTRTSGAVFASGIVRIEDDTGRLVLEKKNAIHNENMSLAIARALSGSPEGHIHEMHFGNGGAIVSGTGAISYLAPNVTGPDADLYNPTFFKVVDQSSTLNTDPTRNFITVFHGTGDDWSDVQVQAVLDFSEPAGQSPFDNTADTENEFVFDEIGLKTYDPTLGRGLLLTHVIFSPVQKSANRSFRILYTVRIRLGAVI